MARFRPTEYCFKCGKVMKAIYKDIGETFIGDSFSHAEHDGECEGETEEYKNFVESAKISHEIFNNIPRMISPIPPEVFVSIYNDTHDDSYITYERLSCEEIVKRYSETLTEEEIKKLINKL